MITLEILETDLIKMSLKRRKNKFMYRMDVNTNKKQLGNTGKNGKERQMQN